MRISDWNSDVLFRSYGGGWRRIPWRARCPAPVGRPPRGMCAPGGSDHRQSHAQGRGNPSRRGDPRGPAQDTPVDLRPLVIRRSYINRQILRFLSLVIGGVGSPAGYITGRICATITASPCLTTVWLYTPLNNS